MEHYFTQKPTSKLKIVKIEQKIKGIRLDFFSGPGVFSNRQIDNGTRILIENCIIKDTWEVLDLGCGIGTIGIFIKKLYPNTRVVMTDVNERAVYLARKNAKLNKLYIEIRGGDLFDNIDQKFDCILTNPPQTAGKETCIKIIVQAKNFLRKGGSLQLVARHNKGGRTLEQEMKHIYNNVQQLTKKSGYRVYMSTAL